MSINKYMSASEMHDIAEEKLDGDTASKIEICLAIEKRVERLLAFSVNEIEKCAKNGSMYTTLTLYQAPDAIPGERPYFGYSEKEICSLCMMLSYLGFMVEISNFSYENEPEKYTVITRWDELSSVRHTNEWRFRGFMLDRRNET